MGGSCTTCTLTTCDRVIVVTNNYFTSAAIELAQSNDVILWNRDMLKEKIKELM